MVRPGQLVAALGAGASLSSAPALAQQVGSATSSIRMGSSALGGALGVRLAVYDRRSFEISWSRVPGATTYRVRVGGRTVQESDATSRYVANVDLSGGFDYTLTALGRAGEVLASRGFRVQPAASPQLVGTGESGGTGNAPTPANLRAEVYSSTAAEVFWDRASVRGLSYEALIGDRVIRRTDGTSAFLSGLARANGTRVEVVAVGPDGRRSTAASVTLGRSGGGDPTPPGGDAPAAPSNLRADVYSSSAGEVFWDRVSGTRLEYEVSLDGEVAATTTGTSYFVGSRPGIDGTRVEVVAIGPDGTRSSASSTTLGDGGSSNPDPEPGTDGPPAPANARIEVYSSTAAELFFDRAPASANVVETEISRDGEVVGTTNGTSFFDPDRVQGRDYVYELVAVDASGNRSSASTVGEASPEPGQDPNLPAQDGNRLAVLFDAANGDVFDTLLGFLDRLGTRDDDAERTPLSSAPDPDFPRAGPREVFDCPDGGTFALAAGSASGVGPFYSTIDDLTVDGTFLESSTIDATGGPSSRDVRFTDYRVAGGGIGTRVSIGSGEVVLREPAAQDGGEYVPVRWIARDIVVADGEVAYSAASQVTSFPETISPDPAVTFGLEVTIEGFDGGGFADATVETVEGFRRTADAERFTTGSLRIVDVDRSATLDADGGDPATFLYTTEENGTTTSYTVPWSDRFDFERVDPTEVEFDL